jgi:bifunctional DNA-binding transcriptional regulator/antitoxin component of YhaV-PrlF toxin-antitoxin module
MKRASLDGSTPKGMTRFIPEGAHILRVRRGGFACYVTIPAVIRKNLAIGRFDYLVIRQVGDEIRMKKVDLSAVVGDLGKDPDNSQAQPHATTILKSA